ncbi:MAG TPA: hypothetical protein VEA99_03695 [Gemmatimonadaceae bacterium]|nr:hypothetical protein [Gemmatimonadaceae bacterium]
MALRSLSRRTLLGVATLSLAACATTGTGGGTTTGGTTGTPGGAAEQTPSTLWPVKTREHVDLWLHGYAMLQADTARVPLFRRGYQSRLRSLRQERGLRTRLDAETEALRARLASNPSLVNGQFLPLYFGSWEDMRRAIDVFFQAQGNPNATGDPNLRMAIAVVGGAFQTNADREWLRTFVQALDDERQRFYRDWWLAEQRQRAPVVTAVDSVWQRVYRAKFQRYLANTQQAGGELLLSLTLNGEGRTVTLSEQRNAVAVGEPETSAQAIEAVYVFAHEVVNAVTSVALTDNTTPAEQRSGAVNRYAAHVTVRGGAMLLQRLAPELVQGYVRYYLRAAGQPVPSGSTDAAFAAAFPIPEAIRDAITRQLDVVLGGI